jgi:uncharacterized protein YjbI with pentapeptide repeats
MFTGLVVLGGVVVVALWLLWMRRGHRTEFHERFAQPMLVAAIVGLAFALLQVATQLELRDAQQRFASDARLRSARDQLILQITSTQNLRGIDLRREDLRGMYLSGKDLRNANLSSARLAGATLDHVRLDGANLRGADLTGASMQHVSARRIAGADATFRRADLTRARVSLLDDYSLPNFDEAFLLETELRGDFSRVAFRRAQFIGTRMQDATFLNAAFDGAAFGAIDQSPNLLCGASLRDVRFVGDFVRWDLRLADLRGAELLRGSRFRKSDFRETDARGFRLVSKVELVVPSTPEQRRLMDLLQFDGVSSADIQEMGPRAKWKLNAGEKSRSFRTSAYDGATKGSKLFRLHGAEEVAGAAERGVCSNYWVGWRPLRG